MKNWIINRNTLEYVEIDGEIWENDWKLKYPHVKNLDYLNILNPVICSFQLIKDKLFYEYFLAPNGAYFNLYVDITKHNQTDINNAISKIKNQHDVLSICVYKCKPFEQFKN
jgi:hypothetical protein